MSYYAVAKGKIPGVYLSWNDCKKQIDGFKGAKYKKFTSQQDANDFVKNNNMTQSKIDAFLTSSRTDPVESDKNLIVFTDGACSANGRRHAKGSYAVIWPFHPELNYGAKLPENELQTNNRGEFTALLYALCQADILDPLKEKTLIVYTDSQLMINSMTLWLSNWKRNDWKKSDGQIIANLDLIKNLDKLMEDRKLVMKYVPAHTNDNTWEARHNDMVDKLAKAQLI